MPNETNPMSDSIDGIAAFQERLKKATEETEDVKNGDATPEDEQQEPDYILFNAICDSSIEIMSKPIIVEFFSKISDKLGEDLTHNMIEMMAIIMSNSAYAAVQFYDNLLKDELRKQFENIGNTFNLLGADVNAHTGVLEVYRSRLDEIEKRLNSLDDGK